MSGLYNAVQIGTGQLIYWNHWKKSKAGASLIANWQE